MARGDKITSAQPDEILILELERYALVITVETNGKLVVWPNAEYIDLADIPHHVRKIAQLIANEIPE